MADPNRLIQICNKLLAGVDGQLFKFYQKGILDLADLQRHRGHMSIMRETFQILEKRLALPFRKNMNYKLLVASAHNLEDIAVNYRQLNFAAVDAMFIQKKGSERTYAINI